jgi:hypothetical protein
LARVGDVISRRRARSSGATIAVERTGDGSWIEQEPGWMTVCETHSTCVLHSTRALALAHAASPEGWCADCSVVVEGQPVDDQPGARPAAVE